ncbi:MAG: M50 family metallopeptidase, partial [Candidatus Nealsonbacteria bacterium]|nr:M50 family metallopeptidase [Candidatus Nealsonbacteria bacterium]
PFGAFVKICGEEGEGNKEPWNFLAKPIWQRMLIILGGVVSFWIIAVIILSFVSALWGIPTGVDDDEEYDALNPNIIISEVLKDSPAQKAGIEMGDSIRIMKFENNEISVNKVKQVQDFSASHKGKEITLILDRGEKNLQTSLVLSSSSAPMGVGLTRVIFIRSPWYKAPIEGVVVTKKLTIGAINGWIQIFSSLIKTKELPPGAEIVGPVGITHLFYKMSKLGVNYILMFISQVAIFLALTNLLPIPALDGGKMLFLTIEAIKGKAVDSRLEQKITTVCFVLLICLLVVATIKDIIRIF